MTNISDFRPSARGWWTVGLLWVPAAFNYLDRIMVTTMRGSLIAAFPMTEAQFGLLTTVFLVVYGVLSPFTGFLADRCNRARVIVGSLFVWSLVTCLTAHAKTYDQLLATRALMGISEACFLPPALALVVDYHRGATRSLATGLVISGAMVGSGLGGLGGWLAERHGWSYAFSLFGLIGIAYSIALALLLRETPREDVPAPSEAPGEKVRLGVALVGLLHSRGYLLVCAFWGLLSLASWSVLGWMPTYLNEHFHLSQGRAGFSATGYLYAATLFGLVLGGAWADRWSLTRERARILVPVITLCAAAPGLLVAANTNLLPLAIAGLVLYGLASAATGSNSMPIICMVCDPRYRATGIGVQNLVSSVAGGATIYAGGMLRDAHVDISRVFQFGAFGLLVCATLLFLVKPRAKQAP